jgi:hypothetical protein
MVGRTHILRSDQGKEGPRGGRRGSSRDGGSQRKEPQGGQMRGKGAAMVRGRCASREPRGAQRQESARTASHSTQNPQHAPQPARDVLQDPSHTLAVTVPHARSMRACGPARQQAQAQAHQSARPRTFCRVAARCMAEVTDGDARRVAVSRRCASGGVGGEGSEGWRGERYGEKGWRRLARACACNSA